MSFWSWFNNAFDVGAALAPPPLRLVKPVEAPSRDEFEAWRDNDVTRFVMAALARNADECRDEWLRLSWEGGEADQRKLDGLRERSDALLGFTAGYEAFCETLGLEPEQEEQAA
jgi:hypothetical protein